MHSSIIERFEQTVEKFGAKRALEFEKQAYTFLEMQELAKKLGSIICDQVDSINNPVVVLLPKSAHSLISFLGVLYSGNYYVPMDYHSAQDRIQRIIQKLKPSFIISTHADRERIETLPEKKMPVFFIEDLFKSDHNIDQGQLEDRYRRIIDRDPLYLMFTSGSTGEPKGVLVPQQSVINYMDWVIAEFNIDEKQIIGNQCPFFFDVSVTDVYLCFLAGATLVIIPEELFVYMTDLVSFMNAKKISFLIWVPSALVNVAKMKLLENTPMPHLKYVLFCGEVMPNLYLNYWRRHVTDAVYANFYGPTEATVACTCYVVDREFDDEESLPIGFPCGNTGILILNEKNQPAEVGEEGELCVRGTPLALGYIDDPEKTGAAFIQNPLNKRYPEKIYKTGDFVKRNERGEIIFIGRADNQIKFKGYRIELGEIENSLLKVPGITNAFVFFDRDAEKIVTFCETGDGFMKKTIRPTLIHYLPKYMIPHKFFFLDRLPATPNGKKNRNEMMRMYYEGSRSKDQGNRKQDAGCHPLGSL